MCEIGGDGAINKPIQLEDSIAAAPTSDPAKGKRGWKRVLWHVTRFLLVLYLGWLATLYFMQERLIFPGWHQRSAGDSLPKPERAEGLWLQTADGCRVEAWFIPGTGRSVENPGPLVIYAHGNGDLIDDFPDYLKQYTDWGISLLLPEYRGYGRSSGSPSEAGIVADYIAITDQVLARPEVDRRRVLFHGHSVGGGVLAALADRNPPSAMILECTFTSMAAMAHTRLAPGFLVRHPFRTDEVIQKLKIPLLIMHGSNDWIIPVSHGRALHDLAPHSQYWECDSGHNDFPEDDDLYWEQIEKFLGRNGFLD